MVMIDNVILSHTEKARNVLPYPERRNEEHTHKMKRQPYTYYSRDTDVIPDEVCSFREIMRHRILLQDELR